VLARTCVGLFALSSAFPIAAALLGESRRPVWLLDEPTSALDVATQALLAAQMRAHLDSGGMILAATHGDLGLEPMRRLEIGA